MNNKLLALGMLAGIAGSPVVFAAGDGTLNFNGSVSGATCTVGVNGGGASPTITLPDVAAANFTAAGVTQGTTNINFALTKCLGTAVKASVYFDGGAGVNTDGTLKNTATGTNAANAVALQIADSNGKPVIIGSTTQLAGTSSPITLGAANLQYSVQYIATAIPVTPGSVNAAVTYSINYL